MKIGKILCFFYLDSEEQTLVFWKLIIVWFFAFTLSISPLYDPQSRLSWLKCFCSLTYPSAVLLCTHPPKAPTGQDDNDRDRVRQAGTAWASMVLSVSWEMDGCRIVLYSLKDQWFHISHRIKFKFITMAFNVFFNWLCKLSHLSLLTLSPYFVNSTH